MRETGEPRNGSDLPVELGQLLNEIEREPVPEKLLDLAIRLQAELQKQRAAKSPQPQPAA